jgi:hypothetical protein
VVQEACNRTPVLLPEPVLDDEVSEDKKVHKDAFNLTKILTEFCGRIRTFFLLVGSELHVDVPDPTYFDGKHKIVYAILLCSQKK